MAYVTIEPSGAYLTLTTQTRALRSHASVRYLDDAGKHPDMQTPNYWHFAPMVQRMVDRHCDGDE